VRRPLTPYIEAMKTTDDRAATPPAPEQCVTMADVRAGVDALDRDLVGLLATRERYIRAAARIKPAREFVRDDARIADVISKVRAEAAVHGLDPDLVEGIYRDMVERFIAHELAVWDRTRG
jgi:isochorismate pyruvate lyase